MTLTKKSLLASTQISNSLALQDKCKDHITVLVRMMPDIDYIETFLTYFDEMAHLGNMFEEKLYEEKLRREKKRDTSSK